MWKLHLIDKEVAIGLFLFCILLLFEVLFRMVETSVEVLEVIRDRTTNHMVCMVRTIKGKLLLNQLMGDSLVMEKLFL